MTKKYLKGLLKMLEILATCVYATFCIFVLVLLIKSCLALIELPRQIEQLPDRIARKVIELQQEESRTRKEPMPKAQNRFSEQDAEVSDSSSKSSE